MSANVFCITPSSFQKKMLMTSAAPLCCFFFLPHLSLFLPFPPCFVCKCVWKDICVLRQLPHLNWEASASDCEHSQVASVCHKRKKNTDNCIEIDSCAVIFFFLDKLKNASHDSFLCTSGSHGILCRGHDKHGLVLRVDQLFIPACFDTSHSHMTPSVSTFTSFVLKGCGLLSY